MARAAAHFTQADVVRVLKAAAAAGLSVARIEIDPTGRIVAVLDSAGAASAGSDNEWDEVLLAGKRNAAAGTMRTRASQVS